MEQALKILELFSGTESFSKVARERGHKTFTVDIDENFNPDLVKNILDLKVNDIPFKPDVIWASPPCNSFSVASIGRFWNKDHIAARRGSRTGTQGIKGKIKRAIVPKELCLEIIRSCE